MIGFLGPHGTYTEQAAKFFAFMFGETSVPIRPYASITQVFDAVEVGDVMYAALPIENSLEGSVLVTLDRLSVAPLYIFAEVSLPIRHAVFGWKDTDHDRVKQVLSHPQALAQCRNTLLRLFPYAVHIDVDSTAAAIAKVAKEQDPTQVCVGSVEAGQATLLQLLHMDAQDVPDNVTRFVLIGQQEHPVPVSIAQAQAAAVHKTSLLLQLGDDHPGALYDVLKVFAKSELNLSRLESRPTKKGLGSYQFYLDVLGVRDDARVLDALQQIEQIEGFSMRDLGSYPCFTHFK